MSFLPRGSVTPGKIAHTMESMKRKRQEAEIIFKKSKIQSQPKFTADDATDNSRKLAEKEEIDSIVCTNTVSNSPIEEKSYSKEDASQADETYIISPQYGQVVNRREFRRAGPYIIGLKLGHSPVDSIVQYLAKKENSNEFVQLKILILNNNTANEKLLQDERQGKMLLHTEFSLLSLLQNQEGVIQQHGMFSDMAFEEVMADSFSNNNFYTGAIRKRLVLVLDCVTPHDFDPSTSSFINLQQYLINRKKISEQEALRIFYQIVTVVENLHKRNVIHRDLKLGNIVLNTHSHKIKIINFCLGKYLLNENDLLHDQRGSPAYISPDVLCGKPYKGKPSDMWALGVVLFMMLYRQFPFFESTPAALFKKIKLAEYCIPMNSEVCKETERLIKGLLQLNPELRLTASQVREKLKFVINAHSSVKVLDHVVPEFPTNTEIMLCDRCLKTSQMMTKNASNKASHDQVVPTFTIPTAKLIPSNVQKQRRLLEPKILRIVSCRGVSVEHIGGDARQLSTNDIGRFQLLFQTAQNRSTNGTVRINNVVSSAIQTPQPSVTTRFLNRERNRISLSISQPIARTFAGSYQVRTRNIISGTSLTRNIRSNNISTSISSNNIDNLNIYSRYLTLTPLYRCPATSRNQQSVDVNREDVVIRHLIRHTRRSRPTTAIPLRRL